ncbi:hypothetical protein SLEP1_g45819 [Rubroshorea leprosula]|uniref:Acid phosphatase/vanadium-dependent haloperoxidase-related protein n=1 Tax=Rubroshorea leprosula TaxID=152421 RepID=A0AAV5LL26_9ROSI|nr:hypothetical protein SLEP1_g45819 [Rubroshorea leprosula]
MLLQCTTSQSFTPLSSHTSRPRTSFVRYPRKHSKFTCFLHVGLDDVAQIAHNKVLIAAGVAAAIGQLSKPFTAVILYGRNFDFKAAFQAGGFPSTHSSSVLAAATTLALERGFSDSLFGLTVVYAGLVMYDAQGVRREVGNHARALNKVLPKSSINSIASKDKDGFIDLQRGTSSTLNMASLDPRSSTNSMKSPQLVTTEQRAKQTTRLAANYDESPLKESIGHTEVEVVAGALLGFLVSLAVYAVM